VCSGTAGFCEGGNAGLTIVSPTNNAIFETAGDAEDVTVAVEVSQVVIGAETFHVAWFLDGALVHQQDTTAPYVFVGVPAGRRHLAAQIVSPGGEALESEDSLDGVHVQVRAACEDASTCDDGLQCSNHACSSGVCKFGPVNGCCDHDLECPYLWVCSDNACIECFGDGDCNDFNPCTIDACDASSTCTATPIADCCLQDDDCDDSDACTADTCDGDNDCVFTDSSATCQGENSCKSYSCDPVLGCQQSNLDVPCDDNDACTLEDACQGGVCQGGGTTLGCDDDNPCTDDICDPETGCVFTPNQATCDDQDACTVGDSCQEGACVPGIPLSCEDGNLCTDDACDPLTGCAFTPNAAPCDDGSVCTQDDACDAGACVGGTALPCSDGNLCTHDDCDDETGCFFPANNVP
ncbi:MAG: hypothetical protein VX938_10105, partial [Myxococcota bacterium]|nr:hypothetical protein [Myxococcota bacterium]